jgi:hypothetical protein
MRPVPRRSTDGGCRGCVHTRLGASTDAGCSAGVPGVEVFFGGARGPRLARFKRNHRVEASAGPRGIRQVGEPTGWVRERRANLATLASSEHCRLDLDQVLMVLWCAF